LAWWNSWIGKPIDLNASSVPFWRGFFGASTTSGEVVTVEKALGLDAFWACASLIQDAIGTLPCVLYDASGVKPATGDDLYGLLHDLPNADDTASEFWSMVALCLCTDGNFFAEKKYVGGKLVALNPLHPQAVEIKRDDRNSRYYEYNETYGVGKKSGIRKISEDKMFHVRGKRMPECDRGISPVGVLRNILGSAMAGEKAGAKVYKGGLISTTLLTSDQVLKADQRTQLAASLKGVVGAENAGGVAVLEAGLTPHTISVKPVDAQMLESRQYAVEQICRIFGVPPVMIGHAANGTTTWGSGIEQLILQFSKTCLRPMLQRIEDAIYRDIFTPEQRKKFSVKFNMDAFLEGDSVARANFLTKMSDSGIYTKDEARAYENKPPIPGGAHAIVNGTMQRLDKIGGAPPVQPQAAPQPANTNEPVPAAPKKAA
jgi:HK97 family phage portal protein